MHSYPEVRPFLTVRSEPSQQFHKEKRHKMIDNKMFEDILYHLEAKKLFDFSTHEIIFSRIFNRGGDAENP